MNFNFMEYDENYVAAIEEYLNEHDPEYREEETESDEEDDEESGGVHDVIIIPDDEIPLIRESTHHAVAHVEVEEQEREKRRKREGEGECRSSMQSVSNDPQRIQLNQSEIDGCSCPICFEPWTTGGQHHVWSSYLVPLRQVSRIEWLKMHTLASVWLTRRRYLNNLTCLPCGHLYGFSCIEKWTRQKGRSGKCPQCNKKYTLKDLRKLFAPRIAALDDDSQNRIRRLEAKCVLLEMKSDEWSKKEADWKRRDAALSLKVKQLTERTAHLNHLVKDSQIRSSSSDTPIGTSQGESPSGHNFGLKFCKRRLPCYFELQSELQLDGARLFEISLSRQIILIVRKLPGLGGQYVLTKMSLIPPHDSVDIFLSTCSKAIRDIRLSPSDNNLALFASLGKKLSVLSMESNHVVLSYDLPAAAWSCSWDINNEHNIYAGLQNGMLQVFDKRQTRAPMESMMGHTCNPIHSIQSVFHDPTSPGVPTVLSASSIGLCEWNFGSGEERPFLVPETANQGVCISLASCPTSGDIVASYRPRVQTLNEVALTQPSFTQSPIKEKGIAGLHSLLKRVSGKCYQEMGFSLANLPDVRLPRSTIIDGSQDHLFASGDELISGLVLQELPSLAVVQHLQSQTRPILDIKYSHVLGQGLIGCLRENKLELSTGKAS